MYLITHIMTGKIYIGIHSTNYLPEEDPYMGSGAGLKEIDPSLLRKTIITTFPNRELAIIAEMLIVTEDFCLREDTINRRTGGDKGWLVDKSVFFQGIARAKAQGRFRGRKPTVDKEEILKLLAEGNSMRKVAVMTKTSLSTVTRTKDEAKQASALTQEQ
jgi:hypothetical protein